MPEAVQLEEAHLEALVRAFYERARQDPVLGPIFATMVEDWEHHIRVVTDFWSRILLGSQPGWALKLMVLRDVIVARFGIRTAKQMEARPGTRIGIFRIFAVSDDEIIVGEDDSHLDFRLSVLRNRDAGPHGSITMSSVVHCHNWVGRAYILLIRPFHKLIVRRSLARAVKGGLA